MLCALSVSVPALGQERRPYVGGGLTVSTQGSERPGSSPSFPTSGVGGTAAGLVVDAGGFLATRVSVAFEASIPARFESIQETDYFLVFRTASKHRDLVLSGLFHVHGGHGGRVGYAIVGGPAVVREDTLQRTAHKSGPALGITGDFGPFGPETSVTRWTVGVTAGADAAVRLGTPSQRRAAISVSLDRPRGSGGGRQRIPGSQPVGLATRRSRCGRHSDR